MGRGSLSSKRKALVISLVFVLLFTLFQSWSYYNIAEKSYPKPTLPPDIPVTLSKFSVFRVSTILNSEPALNLENSLLNNIFMRDESSDQFWLKVEDSVDMNHSKEFKYTSREIHPMFKHMYKPDEDGMFNCFQTGERIHYSKINDDYCDCTDGSDEPSTPACNNGRFYCKYQSSFSDLAWVPSSRLDDGVCDCPDGSDETKPFRVPSLELKEKMEGRCQDNSEEMKRRESEFNRVQEDGLKIKNEWISEVADDKEILENRLFGVKGEFYKLKSMPCWIFRKSKYIYTICPFEESTQESFGNKVVIGKSPKWLKYNPKSSSFRNKTPVPEKYILQSDEGDRKSCPGHPRKTVIIFSCDVDNKVLDISEKELCFYEVHFSTPAAC